MKSTFLGPYDALLVQDISGLYETIAPYLQKGLEYYQQEGVTEEGAFTWIIREEIEKIYLVFDDEHVTQKTRNNQRPYQHIHQIVNVGVDGHLSEWIRHLVKVPNLFHDPRTNLIVSVRVIHFQDIQIWYTKHPLFHWQSITGQKTWQSIKGQKT